MAAFRRVDQDLLCGQLTIILGWRAPVRQGDIVNTKGRREPVVVRDAKRRRPEPYPVEIRDCLGCGGDDRRSDDDAGLAPLAVPASAIASVRRERTLSNPLSF